MEVIVTFMAVLELIRLREIVCVQKRAFEDIEIVRNKANVPVASEEQATSPEIQTEPAGEHEAPAQEAEPTQTEPAPEPQEPDQNP
jgi:hypothetical protein